MANAFDPSAEPDSAPPPDAGGSPDAGGGSPPPGGPPPGGGPILAMLGRQQMSPPVTAPGPGNMAQGMMMLTQAHGLLTQALQNFPAGTPQWKATHRAIGDLGKHMSQDAPGAGVQQTQLGDMLKSVVRNALLQKIMQSRGQGGGPGSPSGGPPSGGGAPPGGGPEQGGAPPPSMPLPGA